MRGKWKGNLRNTQQATQETIYVVERLSKPLLGRPAIQGLELVKVVSAVDKQLQIQEQFPSLFQGLGKLDGDYTIQILEGAKPFALSAPRRVAMPLLNKVKDEWRI